MMKSRASDDDARSVASNASFLDAFDFSSIEEMDPSLAEGHRVVYDREVPVELRVQDSETGPQEVGTLEGLKCKILSHGGETSPQHARIELSTETTSSSTTRTA